MSQQPNTPKATTPAPPQKRLSPRGIAATVIFMAVAIVTVFVTRHLIGA